LSGIFTVMDFVSDPSSVPILPTLITVENGSLQYVGSYFNDRGEEVALSIQSPVTTPVPAALPLFATGLVGLGWLARRRKQKQTAAV
jgi:hypothetical protein